MKDFLVRWEIEISAETPEDAAREALRAQRDPGSLATVFEVQERVEDGYEDPIRIDVEEIGYGSATDIDL